jgi:hypothetical protein
MSAEEIDRITKALTDWWIGQAEDEIRMVAPKAAEYGSNDLAVIGKTMARIAGWDTAGMTEEEANEVGIFFYVTGKIARWEDALRSRRRTSDDTLYDAGIYLKMAQRNRAVGGWPYGPDPDQEVVA